MQVALLDHKKIHRKVKEAGLTQKAFATAVGVNVRSVSDWCNSDSDIRLSHYCNICSALGLTLDEGLQELICYIEVPDKKKTDATASK